MKRTYWLLRAQVLLAALLFAGSAVTAFADEEELKIGIHWVNLQPDDGLIVDAVALFFHDGSFDLYQEGQPASPLLQKLAKREFNGVQALVPDVKFAAFTGPHERSPSWNFRVMSTAFWLPLSPTRHRYATAYIALRPSNDAFLGHADSYRIRLFDLAGKSEAPVVVDFGTSDVMDAGLCVNDEAKLHFLDVREMSDQTCVAENGVVRRHPGFNGSVRNPSGTPKRILGGTSIDMEGITRVRQYDPVNADFSRGGTQIGRLVFTKLGTLASATGSYYNPGRAGEGFNVEVFRQGENGEDTTVVYWYTFEPGTGRPLWLTGSGDIQTGIVLHSAHGGAINSPDNPSNVVRKRWGTLRLPYEDREFDWCGNGLVFNYTPDDPAIPPGQYFVERLTPLGDAVGALCAKLYPPTRHVH